jgi:hypothetical protein
MSTAPSSAALKPPGTAAAEALSKAGILPGESVAAAAAVLARHQAPTAYPFDADSVFLQHCMSYHVGAYFRQVMEPAARAHRANSKITGKLFRDDEVENAARVLVETIAGELSPGYTEHMYKYFGDLDGLATYLYSRVRGILIEEALKYNNEFIDRVSKGSQAAAIVKANSQAGAP